MVLPVSSASSREGLVTLLMDTGQLGKCLQYGLLSPEDFVEGAREYDGNLDPELYTSVLSEVPFDQAEPYLRSLWENGAHLPPDFLKKQMEKGCSLALIQLAVNLFKEKVSRECVVLAARAEDPVQTLAFLLNGLTPDPFLLKDFLLQIPPEKARNNEPLAHLLVTLLPHSNVGNGLLDLAFYKCLPESFIADLMDNYLVPENEFFPTWVQYYLARVNGYQSFERAARETLLAERGTHPSFWILADSALPITDLEKFHRQALRAIGETLSEQEHGDLTGLFNLLLLHQVPLTEILLQFENVPINWLSCALLDKVLG